MYLYPRFNICDARENVQFHT